MKKVVATCLLPVCALLACNKPSSDVAAVSLTASSTRVAVGSTLTVSASTSTNALSWTVTPANNVQKTYSVTTEKTNYFTFSQPGTYTIGIRTASLLLDSIHHCDHTDSIGEHHQEDSVWNHTIDSMWHHEGHHLGSCRKGVDSASVEIEVQ